MDNNHMGNGERRMEYMLGNYYCMVHVIRPGDTLYRLSRQYGVKVSALMMANPFVDIYNLRIGDELCIPRLGRPENMPMRPMPGMPENMPMRPMPGMPENMPNRPVPEMPARMMSDDYYNDDERVINAEMPKTDDRIED